MLNTKNTNALQSTVLIIFLKPTYVSSHLFLRSFRDTMVFEATNFSDRYFDYLENSITDTFEDQFAARKVRDDEALPAKVSCTRIKIDLQ